MSSLDTPTGATSIVAAVEPFTPSELVYLRAPEFAKKSLVGNTKLLDGETKVDAEKLGVEMLTAAALAVERTGAVRLAVGERKSLFGLVKWKALEARPAGEPPAWPEGTFEGVLERWAVDLAARGDAPRVHDILHGYLGNDSSHPWEDVMTLAKRGMAARGVLDADAKKVMKVFTRIEYALPERSAAAAAAADLAPVRALVESAERDRPEFAKLVRKTVKDAVASRYESADTD